MKRILIILIVFLALATAAAADLVLNLSPGDSGTVNCATGELVNVTSVPQQITADCVALATDTPVPPTDTPPPTPTPAAHDVTLWHPPGDGHHHGADISASSLYTLVMVYAGQEIGYPWLSSPAENVYPYPAGKHEGFTWLIEEDTGCDNFNLTAGTNCVKSYALLVHSLGTIHALHTRFHSYGLAVQVCGENGSPPCGFIFTGGHLDGGILHNSYKVDACHLPNDPPNYPYPPQPDNEWKRAPYRTGHRTTLNERENNPQLWNHTGPGGLFEQTYYPHMPHEMARVSWTSFDGWQYAHGDPILCADPAQAVSICPDGSCAMNHSKFVVTTIRFKELPTARPFIGFTNVFGHVDASCTEASAACVPLYISADVPQGDAGINRRFTPDDGCDIPLYGPCQEFDDGTLLVMPGYGE